MKGESERTYSRRRFLSTVGVGAGAVALNPGSVVAAPERAHGHGQSFLRPENFGRIFRLRPFAEQSPKVEAALRELGKPGGLLDAADQLSAGPQALIVDPALSANNPNNPDHTAGTTFFGQFLDHDMTFDASSRLARAAVPEATSNFRTPALDLDSVYGAGPVAQQELYDPIDHIKLKIESGGLFEDLPRREDGTAIVGDPRNDENLIISGLHCAFILFHNNAVDHVRAQGGSSDPMEVFAEARRLTTWHYQWMIVHEFLPQTVGQTLVDDVLRRGGRFYRPARGEAYIPVDFQTGAYRMGHSMVRPSYRANLAGDGGQPFFAMVFDPSQEGKADPDDLRGGSRAPRRFIGWQTFFDFGDGQVKPNKKIDTKISTPLFDLPLGAIASHDPPTALRTAQPAPPPHVAASLRAERRPRHGSQPARRRRPRGARAARRRLRAQHSTLVLRPQGGGSRRGRTSPRPRRRPHRRRGLPRPPAIRPGLLRRRPADVAADPAREERNVPDDRLPHLRRRRPALARPVDADPPAVSLSVQDMP